MLAHCDGEGWNMTSVLLRLIVSLGLESLQVEELPISTKLDVYSSAVNAEGIKQHCCKQNREES